MKVFFDRVLETPGIVSDIVISIECGCGNRRMKSVLDGNFASEKLFIFLHGPQVKNFRCFPSGGFCPERYRIAIHKECDRPYIEIWHVGLSGNRVGEPQKIKIPEKVGKKSEMYPRNGWSESKLYF